MDWIPLLIVFLAGFALGIVVALLLRFIQSRSARELAEDLLQKSEALSKEHLEALTGHMKASFGNLSLEALAKSTEEFLKLAKARFDSEREVTAGQIDAKKGLIDEQLKRMSTELERMSALVQTLERDRVAKFGELATQLKSATEQTAALTQATHTLREALASTKVRGQWGERMAEDILRLVGLEENINYLKQRPLKGGGTRPDFTFLLPKGLKLNMDVKFPLDNYLRFLESGSEAEKSTFRNQFLRDAKARIKEVTGREYINPQARTLDYVLLFIPNEQIYAFIQEQDPGIIDRTLKKRVILCSPLTLFAVLGVVRQAVESFALEETSSHILSLLGTFHKEWTEFTKKMETMGRRLQEAQKEYESLMTTRRRQLERPLKKIEDLKRQHPSSPLPQDAAHTLDLEKEE